MVFKISIVLLFLGFGFFAKAEVSSCGLTAEDQKLVLERLNEICGDVWCEGDYDVDFNSIQLAWDQSEKKHDVINFVVSDRDSEEIHQKDVACEIADADLMEDFVSNLKFANNPQSEFQLFQIIDSCIPKNIF